MTASKRAGQDMNYGQIEHLDFAVPSESEPSLTVQVNDHPHLILMRIISDDRFASPNKRNGALQVSRTPDSAQGERWHCLNFDSPMNAFPGEYYYRVAKLESVTLTLRFTAPKWRARLMRRQGNWPPEVVAQEIGTGAATISMDAPLRGKPDRFYLELSYSGSFSPDLMAWTSPQPATLPPLGISITTYNKQAYLLPNLDALTQSAAFKAGLLDILVVNNGDDLGQIPEGIDVKTLNNVGGTGGFLEGHRHFREKGYKYFVIMDDDISIAPDFADRLYALSCLSKDYHIGSLAEILNISDRIIKEQGADVSEDNVFGLRLHNQNMDLQGYDRHRIYGFWEADFSGWWSLMVALDGPPPRMPRNQFIKRDDVMFGYESRRQGTSTVVFPNLIVAHGEEGAPTYYYYDIRNDLILRARNHPPLSMSLKQLVRIAGWLMLTLRIDRQRMFNAALADFMKGPKALDSTDIGTTLRRIKAMAQKTVPLPKAAKTQSLGGGGIPSYTQLALQWVRPSAWRQSSSPPIINDNVIRHCMGRYNYYERVPFSDTGYLRKRSLRSIFQFLRSLGLIVRLGVTRNALMKAYKKGADQ